ncbi:MAG TPA: hypothetical protein EYG71_01765 [Leucothrix sp.]|nr:hypothetical protein [Leucothrix sp.]
MKTLLLTISATALLLLGQSAMAFEQINAENGYDSSFRNGWVNEPTAYNLDLFKPAYTSRSSNGFEQINSENGYDVAFRNGWVSPETAQETNLDLMKASFRNSTVDMFGQYEDATSINYISTY